MSNFIVFVSKLFKLNFSGYVILNFYRESYLTISNRGIPKHFWYDNAKSFSLGMAFPQCQYSFTEVRDWEAVKIFIYGPIISVDTKRFPETSFIRCGKRWKSEGAKQIVPQMRQFSYCQQTFVSRYVVLMKNKFFKPNSFSLIFEVTVIFAFFKVIN